jgi:hypothetical protein
MHPSKYSSVSCALPNIVVEWFTLLRRIWEVPGSSLWRLAILTEGFRGFPNSSRECLGSTLKLGHDFFLRRSFPIYHSQITLLFDAI